MVEPCLSETRCFIKPSVKSHNGSDIVGSEVLEVVFGSVKRVAIFNRVLAVWSGKSNELPYLGQWKGG